MYKLQGLSRLPDVLEKLLYVRFGDLANMKFGQMGVLGLDIQTASKTSRCYRTNCFCCFVH